MSLDLDEVSTNVVHSRNASKSTTRTMTETVAGMSKLGQYSDGTKP